MSARVRVKVCGLTTPENARAVAELGIDEVGFNFYAPSLRCVSPERAREIAGRLPPEVRRVGVFVDEAADQIDRIADFVGLDRLQLHGQESRDFCVARRAPVIKAFRCTPEFRVADVEPYRPLPVLLDGFSPGLPGGSGRTADWEAARLLVDQGFELYLAGGLGPENVAEALAAVRPAVIDLNSGIESAPGIKDLGRLAALLEVLRHAGAVEPGRGRG